MDKNLALGLAKEYIPQEKKPVKTADLAKNLKVSEIELGKIDTNNDQKISQSELAKGLETDQLKLSDDLIKGSKTKANVVSFFPDQEEKQAGPESFREGATYKGEQWFKDAFNPNVGLPDSPYQGIRGSSVSGISGSDLKDMIGKPYAEVAEQLKTPYDVAKFLDKALTYQDERAGGGVGPGGTYTNQELLNSGTGVCRDYHTLAASILKDNGYDAKMFGYSSADSTFHAFTVYQDPQTGKWGAVEYGKVYPPELLDADSAEEAFLKVRPDALVIRQYTLPDNPNEGAHIDKVIYTPTAREFSSFALGRHSGNLGATVTNNYTELSGNFANKNWEYAVRYYQPNANSMTPVLNNSAMAGVWYNFDKLGIKVGAGGGYLPEMFNNTVGPNEKVALETGFAFGSIEGNHPKLLGVDNIGNTGININLNSRFSGFGTLAFNKSGDTKDADGTVTEENHKMALDRGISSGLSRFNWNPDITINREFDLWGDRKNDLNLYAKYGTDVDALLMGSFYHSGGKGLPVTQFLQTGVEAQLSKDVKLSTSAYIPLGKSYSNDFSSEPLVNVRVSTPYVGFSTTQGANTSIYNLDTGVNLTEGSVNARLEAFASFEDDRVQKTFTPRAGARLNFSF